jgi:aspartokinase
MYKEAGFCVFIPQVTGCPRTGHTRRGKTMDLQTSESLKVIKALSLIGVDRRATAGQPDLAGRVFVAIARLNVPVLLISQSSSSGSFCFVVPQEHTAAVLDALRSDAFDLWARDVMLVTYTAQDLHQQLKAVPALCSLLAGQGINILVTAQNAASSVSLVVDADAALTLANTATAS